MGQFLLLLVVALTAAAVVFGVTVLLTGSDSGMAPAEPDGRAVPLPSSRPLAESDVSGLRFDTALRGYRMSQVDQAFQRAAYDIGYKDELIGVLEAEVTALREGRGADAEALRQARLAALAPAPASASDGAGAADGAVRRPGTDGADEADPGTDRAEGAASGEKSGAGSGEKSGAGSGEKSAASGKKSEGADSGAGKADDGAVEAREEPAVARSEGGGQALRTERG